MMEFDTDDAGDWPFCLLDNDGVDIEWDWDEVLAVDKLF
jgi:hypothetical protein